MGSQYGLLLASGARRYCRSAIRATPPSFSSTRVSSSVLSLSSSLSRFTIGEMVVHEVREEERLVGRESFCWNRRHVGRLQGYRTRRCPRPDLILIHARLRSLFGGAKIFLFPLLFHPSLTVQLFVNSSSSSSSSGERERYSSETFFRGNL